MGKMVRYTKQVVVIILIASVPLLDIELTIRDGNG